jgi:hypothetical protein
MIPDESIPSAKLARDEQALKDKVALDAMPRNLSLHDWARFQGYEVSSLRNFNGQLRAKVGRMHTYYFVGGKPPELSWIHGPRPQGH